MLVSLLTFVSMLYVCCFCFFFFNDTATTEIYTLSLHDALPICWTFSFSGRWRLFVFLSVSPRSEEHTSELQSRLHLVCRLLLEKKKKSIHIDHTTLHVASRARKHSHRVSA